MSDSITASTIAQQAFTFMERSPLSALSDDSAEAIDAARVYPQAVDICLEAHDFSFARWLVDLPQLAAVPSGGAADPDLPYTYALPSDCVKLRRISPEGFAWRVDGDLVRADVLGGIQLMYTRRVTDTKLLPASFQTAVSAQIAVLLAPYWVTTRTKRESLKDDFRNYLQLAISADRATASAARFDGNPEVGDWVAEATR